MPTRSAGALRHRVAFDRRSASDDGYGNTVAGDFAQQFECRAEFRNRGGSEAVVAARLEGRNIFGVYVRSSSETRQITADWRLRDLNDGSWTGIGETNWTGPVYAILAVDTITDPAWVYLTVQTGIAA